MTQVAFFLTLLVWTFAQTELQIGKTYAIDIPGRTSPNNLAIFVSHGTPIGNQLKLTVLRDEDEGREIVLIRHSVPPTKYAYDEIDDALTQSHVMQFTTSANETYFGIANLDTETASYNVTLTSLKADTPYLSWEEEPIPVCTGSGSGFPLYGPHSLRLGIKTFGVVCAFGGANPQTIFEVRKYNGQLVRSSSLGPPNTRFNKFQEPSVLYVQGFYVVASSFPKLNGNDWFSIKIYREDGSLLRNVTNKYGANLVSQEEYPQLLSNGGLSVSAYWSTKQDQKYGVCVAIPRNRPTDPPSYQSEFGLNVSKDFDPVAYGGFTVLSPWWGTVRIRATMGDGPAILRWIDDSGFNLITKGEVSKFKTVEDATTRLNSTQGGIDLQPLQDGGYAAVHPITWNDGEDGIQLTIFNEKHRAVRTTTFSFQCSQPNLGTVDRWVFLICTDNAIGVVTPILQLSTEDSKIFPTQPIGGVTGQTMINPIFKYDPLLGGTFIMYTGEDQQAYLRRVSLTYPQYNQRK